MRYGCPFLGQSLNCVLFFVIAVLHVKYFAIMDCVLMGLCWTGAHLTQRQNRCHFADAIFKCIFVNENVWILIKISLKFFPKGPINNIPALVQIMTRWVDERFFHRNSNALKISFCSHPRSGQVIPLKFCTCYDTCAVVACAKFCSGMIPCNDVTLKPIFHRIMT